MDGDMKDDNKDNNSDGMDQEMKEGMGEEKSDAGMMNNDSGDSGMDK